jgi:RNA recognition motif-containing protein
MNTKLFVGNLSYNSTDESLRAAFEAAGVNVTRVTVVSDRETGRPRGFGFVQCRTEADAVLAMEHLDGTEVDGRPIRLSESQDSNRRGRRDTGETAAAAPQTERA